MGMIGNFGSRIIFEVSGDKVLTFSGLTQKVSGNYAKHSVIGQKDRPEFTGPGNRSLTLKIVLDVSLGIRPRDVMEDIEQAVETAETEYLVIGGRVIGENRFYISSASEAIDVILGGGEIARVTLNLTLEEYV